MTIPDDLFAYFVSAGVTAIITLLWKVDKKITTHNGALSHVIEEQKRVAVQLLNENGHAMESTNVNLAALLQAVQLLAGPKRRGRRRP